MNYSNNSQKTALSKSIKDGSISHAYIVCGGDSATRDECINNIIKEIFCDNKDNPPCNECVSCRKIDNGNMEDLIVVNKDGNSIKVDQIKSLTASLANKPFSKRTVAIINDSESMTPESQNKLLKSLEEPSAGTIIILSVANVFSLLQTIRSRCIIINIGSEVGSVDVELDEVASNVVKYSMINKPLYMIFDETKKCVDSSSDAEKLLDAMLIFIRDLIVGKYTDKLLFSEAHKETVDRINWDKGFPFEEYLKLVGETKNDIRRGINWKYSLKQMIINFKQEELHG